MDYWDIFYWCCVLITISWSINAIRWWNDEIKLKEKEREEIENRFLILDEIKHDLKKLLKIWGNEEIFHLNKVGEKIFYSVNAKEWARKHVGDLYLHEDMKEYKIFDLCGKYIQKIFNEDIEFQKTIIKIARDHDVDVEQILKVYQFELRDNVIKLFQNDK